MTRAEGAVNDGLAEMERGFKGVSAMAKAKQDVGGADGFSEAPVVSMRSSRL